MKKTLLCFLVCLWPIQFVAAQGIGIGINTPDNSAMLHINSTTKGLLIPSMTQSQRMAIGSPAEGLLVYDLTSKRLFYYQNGTWRFFLDNQYWAGSTTRNWVYNGTDSVGIGTAAPLERLHVNGNIRTTGTLKVFGETGIGVTSPEAPLHVRTTGSGEGVILDAVNPIIQFRQSNTPNAGYSNKGFVQVSGDNLRLGTNSGNTEGQFIIRNNGGDRVFVDAAGNVGIGDSTPDAKLDVKGDADIEGNLEVEGKLTSFGRTGIANLLPLCIGRVSKEGNFSGTPGLTMTKINTGIYEFNHPLFTSTTKVFVTLNEFNAGSHYSPSAAHWPSSGSTIYRVGLLVRGDVGLTYFDAGFSVIAYE